jgi:hypothetical protein
MSCPTLPDFSELTASELAAIASQPLRCTHCGGVIELACPGSAKGATFSLAVVAINGASPDALKAPAAVERPKRKPRTYQPVDIGQHVGEDVEDSIGTTRHTVGDEELEDETRDVLEEIGGTHGADLEDAGDELEDEDLETTGRVIDSMAALQSSVKRGPGRPPKARPDVEKPAVQSKGDGDPTLDGHVAECKLRHGGSRCSCARHGGEYRGKRRPKS